MSTINRHQAGTVIAGSAAGGQFKQRERAAAAPPFSQGLAIAPQEHLESPGALFAQSVLEELRIEGINVDESPIPDAENPAGNVSVHCDGEWLGIGDIVDSDELDRHQKVDGIEARAEHLLNLTRLSNIQRAGATLSDEIAAIRDSEVAALQARIAAFHSESIWAPGNLLLGGADRAYVHDVQLPGGGFYEATVIDTGYFNSGSGQYQIEQRLSVPVTEIDKQTMCEYRTEIQDWLAAHYMGDTFFDPDTGLVTVTFTGDRFDQVPTAELVAEKLIGGDGASHTMHGHGTKTTSYDQDLLFRYLQRTEKVDPLTVSMVRAEWDQAPSQAALVRVKGHDMAPEEWAAALGSAFEGKQNEIALGMLPLKGAKWQGAGNNPIAGAEAVRKFAQDGVITDRAVTASQMRAFAQVEGLEMSEDLRDVALLLADRLERGGLRDRDEPRRAYSRA